MEESVQREPLPVCCLTISCFLIEPGIYFMKLALGYVFHNLFQVIRTPQHEVREMRGATLLSARYPGQKNP